MHALNIGSNSPTATYKQSETFCPCSDFGVPAVHSSRGPLADSIYMIDLSLQILPVRRLRCIVRASVTFTPLRRAVTVPLHDVHDVQ